MTVPASDICSLAVVPTSVVLTREKVPTSDVCTRGEHDPVVSVPASTDWALVGIGLGGLAVCTFSVSVELSSDGPTLRDTDRFTVRSRICTF